jgi:hypothetical protein
MDIGLDMSPQWRSWKEMLGGAANVLKKNYGR